VSACARLSVRAPDSSRLNCGRRGRVSEAKPLQAEVGGGLDGLYRRYAAWLNRRLRARIGPDDAADVVQETYIRIAPFADGGIAHPRAFLLRVALNLVRDDAKHRRRRPSDADLQSPESEGAPQFDQVLLAQIIRSMPQLYRDVFVLSRFDGMTYPEIAKELEISVKTVEWRMSKALDYCALRLDL